MVKAVFEAARTGQTGILKFLLPPSGKGDTDKDCIALCNPGNENMREELGGNYVSLADFRTYFSGAKIVGSPVITGTTTAVNFVFGPNLERSETFNLQLIEGKWYLASF